LFVITTCAGATSGIFLVHGKGYPNTQSSIAFCTEQRKPSIPRSKAMDFPCIGSCTCMTMLTIKVIVGLLLDASYFDNLLPLSDPLLKQPLYAIGYHLLPYIWRRHICPSPIIVSKHSLASRPSTQAYAGDNVVCLSQGFLRRLPFGSFTAVGRPDGVSSIGLI
jgi:hypothetical protein